MNIYSIIEYNYSVGPICSSSCFSSFIFCFLLAGLLVFIELGVGGFFGGWLVFVGCSGEVELVFVGVGVGVFGWWILLVWGLVGCFCFG
jgi:hypothetical protein